MTFRSYVLAVSAVILSGCVTPPEKKAEAKCGEKTKYVYVPGSKPGEPGRLVSILSIAPCARDDGQHQTARGKPERAGDQ